jgi:hypothetical protein
VSLEAGAKVIILFLTGKKNVKFFLEKLFPFLNHFPYQYFYELYPFCGVQNYNLFSNLTNFFESFFENVFPFSIPYSFVSLSVYLRTYASLRVQKYNTYSLSQAFLNLFLNLFFQHRLTG